MITSVFWETQITTGILGGNHMADMLVKLYNIPHSHDTEENLLKSGIRIKKALALTGVGLSLSHVMRQQLEIFSALWLCWKVKEKRV